MPAIYAPGARLWQDHSPGSTQVLRKENICGQGSTTYYRGEGPGRPLSPNFHFPNKDMKLWEVQ